MALYGYPQNLTASPVPGQPVVKLTWDVIDIPESYTGGGLAGGDVATDFVVWGGRVVVLKNPFGFSSSPQVRGTVTLCDTVLDATEAVSLQFVDDGSTDSIPRPAEYVWTSDGPGLPGGVRYYYTVLLGGVDGVLHCIPSLSSSSAYAYGEYGHEEWLRGHLPRYMVANSTAEFRSLLGVIGAMFDTMKTDADRMAFIGDLERVDEDMLYLLAQRVGWPLDGLPTALDRRRELLGLAGRLRRRGILQEFQQLSVDAAGIAPSLHREWKTMLYTNGLHSPRFIPIEASTVLYDFGDAEWWITDGDEQYWGALGVREVTVLTLPPVGDRTLHEDDFFVGCRVVVESDTPQGSVVVSFDPLTRHAVLLDKVDVDDGVFVNIMLGTPVLNGPFANGDLHSAFLRRSAPVMRTPSPTGSSNHTGIFVTVCANSANDNTRIGTAVEKLHVTAPVMLTGVARTGYYVKPYPTVERVASPSVGVLIKSSTVFTETVAPPT